MLSIGMAIGNQVVVTALQVEATQYFTKIMVLPQKFPSRMIKKNPYKLLIVVRFWHSRDEYLIITISFQIYVYTLASSLQYISSAYCNKVPYLLT